MNVVGLCLLTFSYLFQNVFSQTCDSSGFRGCECNILGACDIKGNKVYGLDNKFTGYAPKGIQQFHSGFLRENLAYLCEGQTTTIMYDCDERIPLYSATMMTGKQLNDSYNSISSSFRSSGDKMLHRDFQQRKLDYFKSNDRTLCYESKGKYQIDKEWYLSKTGDTYCLEQTCPASTPAHCQKYIETPMARGHLIAAQYGRGNVSRIKATFSYTNTVPQFISFNSGSWRCSEQNLIEWGRDNCATPENVDVRIFIVVGAIPSTYTGRQIRYFGQSGFSDFQGWSKLQNTYAKGRGEKEYRVNVPSFLWTAACCTFKCKGNFQTRSTAFFRSNDPSYSPCRLARPKTLFKELELFYNIRIETDIIDIFPKNCNC